MPATSPSGLGDKLGCGEGLGLGVGVGVGVGLGKGDGVGEGVGVGVGVGIRPVKLTERVLDSPALLELLPVKRRILRSYVPGPK